MQLSCAVASPGIDGWTLDALRSKIISSSAEAPSKLSDEACLYAAHEKKNLAAKLPERGHEDSQRCVHKDTRVQHFVP